MSRGTRFPRLAATILALSASAYCAAEFRAGAYGGAASSGTEADMLVRVALDAASSAILNEAWALKGSAFLDARAGSLSGISALAGLSGDASLSLDALSLSLGASAEGKTDAQAFSLPSAMAEFKSTLRLGEGLAAARLYASRVEEADNASGLAMAIMEAGGELGGEFSLGILVLSPAMGLAYRAGDSAGPGIVLSPRLGLSLYPALPAWADAQGRWERTMENGEDSYALSLSLAWVPLPVLEFSVAAEASIESSSTLLSATVSAALDLGRWGDKSLCLPVNLYIDSAGAMGAEAGLRFAVD